MTETDGVLRERIAEALRDIAVSWRWMSEGPHETDLADAADTLLPVMADVVAERDRLAAEVERLTALSEARQRVIERMAREALPEPAQPRRRRAALDGTGEA